jgi:hypothetical protein
MPRTAHPSNLASAATIGIGEALGRDGPRDTRWGL